MEINKCKKKLKLLFEKFFEENFELSSYYSEKLLKYLDNGDDKCAGKILDTPFFSDLIMYSLANLEKCTTSVKIFITEVFTIVLRNELQFSKLEHLQGFKMLAQNILIFHSDPPLDLFLAGIKALSAHTFHYSGMMRLVNYKAWKVILRPNVHYKATKAAQAIYNLMSKLVWKLNEFDEEDALTEILAHIVEPIRTSGYIDLEIMDAQNEKALYDPVFSSIHTLVAIIRDSNNYSGKNRVVDLLHKYFTIEPPLFLIIQKTRNTDLVGLIGEFLFNHILVLSKDYIQRGIHGDRDIPAEIISIYYNTVLCMVDKGMISATTFFSVKSVMIWAKVDTSPFPVTFERHGRTFNLQNQFITLVLAPLLVHTRLKAFARHDCELIDALEVYIMKLTKINSEHMVKTAYSFRTLIETNDSKKAIILCLREISNLKGCLNVAQAGMLYQALFYTLKLHVLSDGFGALILNENPLNTPDDVNLLSLVMEAIKMLLKEHNINWYENVEIVSLQTTLMNLLKQNFMPHKQLRQAVDLIDLSIKKFLSPDMALLMESKSGSTLNEIGTIMKVYIQHQEWEVRDSTLNLLLSCLEVAYVKYIPLRKLLLENKLTVLAAHAALSDTEFYVQATALRCLAAATKIEGIWREVLTAHPNLYVQLIYVVRYNPEGIVRKEAAKVLTEIYVNQKLNKDCTQWLFNVMATSALNDLHWEAQIAALNFWKNAIHNLMSNRGMIDGKFPAVTFSKEKRKILILNQTEITKQLNEIINELSSIGCLTVLHKCLNEEFNVNVIEYAYDVVKELVTVLDNYKFEGVPGKNENEGPSKSAMQNNSYNISHQDIGQSVEAMDIISSQSSYQTALREQITETILNTSDYDLLVDNYENFRRIKTENFDVVEDVIPPPLSNLINPNDFLKTFKETDYLTINDVKRSWNSGHSNLDLLLDEILDDKRSNICIECN